MRFIPGEELVLTADAAERAALATRFALVAIDSLEARAAVEREGRGARARGRLTARIVQSCAISGEDLPVAIDEAFDLRFVPAGAARTADEEIELDADELDEIEFSGTQFDLGEAIAQSLALAIDPYLTGPQAEEARRKAGLLDRTESGPFAALKALKKD